MLRDVVLHLRNEQPILADLPAAPTAGDTCLICTNLRTLSGKTPLFAERSDSTFVFPMGHIRFVEIRVNSAEATATATDEAIQSLALVADDHEEGYAEPPLERLGWLGDGRKPETSEDEAGPQTADDELAESIEPEEFLRRVREV